MKIDLRYLLTVLSFYSPGLVLLIGSWFLGYSLEESRPFIAFLGASLGTINVVTVGIYLFESRPIWWTIPGTKGDSQ